MPQKYVAAVMNRLSLDDGNFIYYLSHSTVGEIDDKTKIFRDKNGKEYLDMLNSGLQSSEVSKAYYNPIPIESIKQRMKTASTQEAISEYDFRHSNYVYYVSKTEESGVFCVPINLAEYKDKIRRSVEEFNKKKAGTAPDTAKKQEQTQQDNNETKDDTKIYGGKPIVFKDVRSDIATLLIQITNGKYSLDQLKELRKRVKLQQEDMDGLADSLDLQIEASENGESAVTLAGEESSKESENSKGTETSGDKKPKINNYIDIDKLFRQITQTLISQDEPTRRVITEIIRKERNKNGKSRGILITGQTGSGKTKLMQLIAKYIDRPFFKIDSTQLTIPGYVGKDIEEALWDLYVACGKDKNKAEHAIIFFDEIDKKGSSKNDDISGKGVLNVLLPFIEGSTYTATANVKVKGEEVKLNTSNMIVILGGAFTDVYKQLQTKNAIGFGAAQSESKTREAEVEDFVEKAKMPDEFMGRVSIVKLNDLDLNAIKRILLESDESAIRIQKKLFEELGVKLTIGDDYVQALAEKAEKRKTGARGLNTAVDDTTWEAYNDAYTHLGEYDEIILGEETVENPKQYKKVYKKGNA